MEHKKKKTAKKDTDSFSSENNPLKDDLSTQYIIQRTESKKEAPKEEHSLSQMFREKDKDCVRVEIQRDLYNQILELKRKNNSSLSVPTFIQTILREILKNNLL